MDGREIGERIKRRRGELGMTQGDVANKVGVAISTVQRYEKGQIRKTKLPVVEAIARALDVSPSWLIGKSECKLCNIETSNIDAISIDLSKLKRIPILGRIPAEHAI